MHWWLWCHSHCRWLMSILSYQHPAGKMYLRITFKQMVQVTRWWCWLRTHLGCCVIYLLKYFQRLRNHWQIMSCLQACPWVSDSAAAKHLKCLLLQSLPDVHCIQIRENSERKSSLILAESGWQNSQRHKPERTGELAKEGCLCQDCSASFSPFSIPLPCTASLWYLQVFSMICFIFVAITETGSHIAKASPTHDIVAEDVLKLLILPPKHYDSKRGYFTWMRINSKAWHVGGTHWTVFLVPKCSFCSRLLIVAIKTEICTHGKKFLIHTQIYKNCMC